MLEAAILALKQMFSPPMRGVLLKSVGLALVLIVLAAIGLHRVIAWLVETGGTSLEGAVGTAIHVPLNLLAWVLSIAAGLGLLVGGIFLMPAATALVGSFFVDEIAEQVERTDFPADPPGTALPLWRALIEGSRTALFAILVYLCAVPFLLLAGFGVIIFFIATAYLLGREYFDLAAMRFRPREEAKALRKRNSTTVFVAGLFIAAFVSIPIVNLATPLFAMAFMVHMHKRIAGGAKRELIEPARG
jgi:CysZ protein